MKKKQTLRKMMEEHKIEDRVAFSQLPTKEDVINVVGDTVDVKINGKLIGLKSDNFEIKEHLKSQDIDMQWVKYAVKALLGGVGLIFVGLVINILSQGKL